MNEKTFNMLPSAEAHLQLQYMADLVGEVCWSDLWSLLSLIGVYSQASGRLASTMTRGGYFDLSGWCCRAAGGSLLDRVRYAHEKLCVDDTCLAMDHLWQQIDKGARLYDMHVTLLFNWPDLLCLSEDSALNARYTAILKGLITKKVAYWDLLKNIHAKISMPLATFQTLGLEEAAKSEYRVVIA